MQYCNMHHSAVKSNLVDSGSETNKLESRGNDRPLCPKPRRIGPAIPEFLKPQRCSKHRFDCFYTGPLLTVHFFFPFTLNSNINAL